MHQVIFLNFKFWNYIFFTKFKFLELVMARLAKPEKKTKYENSRTNALVLSEKGNFGYEWVLIWGYSFWTVNNFTLSRAILFSKRFNDTMQNSRFCNPTIHPIAQWSGKFFKCVFLRIPLNQFRDFFRLRTPCRI